MDLVPLYTAIFGLAISVFSTFLLYFTFRELELSRFYKLSSIYIFFTLSFLFFAISYAYNPSYIVLAYIFELLAFFGIYYQYFRKEMFIAAIPLAIAGNITLILSLYFLLYNSITILKHRITELYSLVVFASFVLFIISVLLSMLNVIYNITMLSTLGLIFLNLGIILFFLPLYIILIKGEK